MEGSVPVGDMDTMFCLSFKLDHSKGHFAEMVLVLTTRRLIEFPPATELATHNDDTAGCVWQAFSVMLSGTTDVGRKFHLMAISICSKKDFAAYQVIAAAIKQRRPDLEYRHSISDAACAIFNGFQLIFTDLVQHMCWYCNHSYTGTL